MSESGGLPDFRKAVEWLGQQLSAAGYPGEARWIHREDVLLEGKKALLCVTSDEKAWIDHNENLAELRYEYGRRRGLGVRVDLHFMMGKNPCCALWLPRHKEMAEFAQLHPGTLKLRIPVEEPFKAVAVRGQWDLALYSLLYGPARKLGLANRLPLKQRTDVDIQRLEDLTLTFRVSDDPATARLRALAADKGLEADKTVVVEWRADEPGREYGVFVAPDKRVFQFVLNQDPGSDKEPVFSEWIELTDTYRDLPWGPRIRRALERAPLDENEPWEGMFTEG